VTERLLDGDRDIGLRTRLQFLHLGLLMLGEVLETRPVFQVAQCQTTRGLPPDLFDAAFFSCYEH